MRLPAIALLATMAATPSAASEFDSALQAFLETEILGWSQAAEIVGAIQDQNVQNAALDQARIDALDLTWRAEIGSGSTPTIDPVVQGPVADFLRARVDASGGRITEIFIMDLHGLNVAASAITSDMWQGDEAKFTETYGIGPDAVHFSEVGLDESTQRYQAQISLTIVDPATGGADRRHDSGRRRRSASLSPNPERMERMPPMDVTRFSMTNASVFLKCLVLMAGATILVATVLSLLNIRTTNTAIDNGIRELAEAATSSAAAASGAALRFGNVAALEEALDRVLTTTDGAALRAIAVNAQGETLAGTGRGGRRGGGQAGRACTNRRHVRHGAGLR